MNNFFFYTPTKFYFGKGEDKNVGKYVKEFGAKKVMIFRYGAPYEKALIDQSINALKDEDIECVDFCGIEPNPHLEKANEAVEICKNENIDFLLAVGGGSVIDTAKYVSIAAKYDGDAYEDFYLHVNPIKETLPLGVIATIAGTGAEASNSSVISKGKLKRSCNQDIIRPKMAILNPELTYTVPAFQTASGAVDIMAHVHERYFTTDRNTYLTDGLCEAIFRTVIKYLPIALKEPTNYEARASLLWASIIGHNESVGVGRDFKDRYGLAHTIQSEIGGKYNSIHGAGCALTTLGMMKYCYKYDLDRFERYFNQVWGIPLDPLDREGMILRGIKMQEDFYIECGIPVHYADYGVKEEDIPELISTIRRGPDGTISGLHLTDEDMIEIFKLMK